MRPIAIDLFAGAGGMSLGFEQAGFDVEAAVEIDPIHACVHRFNFPHGTVIADSVKNLDGQRIRELSGISGKVSVVCGGAPCQGFSLIGRRLLDDPRNSLVRDYVRIVSELEADYFVFENVKGLTLGEHRAFLDELISAFDERGYEVRLPWKVLNSADFGVPQDRQRLFMLGARRGLPLPVYPERTTARADGEPELGLPSGPSCRDALDDLPNADRFRALIESDEVITTAWGTPSAYAQEMRCAHSGAWHYGVPRRWNPDRLTSSARTDHTEISRRRFAETPPGVVEPISRFFKLSADGISNTLRAGTDAARGAFTSPRPVHYRHPRCITVREMARLHGFPDWFRFHRTKWHGARQIGNAVPPPLARAVAGAIVKAIGCWQEAVETAIELGDPRLLGLEMSAAAAYFGVVCPTQKRDRKSGARKRSQIETEKARLAAMATP